MDGSLMLQYGLGKGRGSLWCCFVNMDMMTKEGE